MRFQHRLNRMRRNKNLRHRRGAAAVEFAIVASVFLTLVFTAIELSRANMIRNLAQDAAYYAARKAMVPGASRQDAVAEANKILALAGTRGATISINGGSDLARDTQEITVVVTVPMHDNSILLPHVTQKPNLTATAVMRTERYENFNGQN